MLSKLGLTSCDLITVSFEKSSMTGPQRSVIADKILKISERDKYVSLCQEAGVPCQQLIFQNPQIYDKIQGTCCLKTTLNTFTLTRDILKKPPPVWSVCSVSLHWAARDSCRKFVKIEKCVLA